MGNYNEMDQAALVREAKSRGIRSVNAEDGEEDAGTTVEDASKAELVSALEDYDAAQQNNVGAGGEDGDEGTSKNADRSKQSPGAGDPKVDSSVKEGGSQMGNLRGTE